MGRTPRGLRLVAAAVTLAALAAPSTAAADSTTQLPFSGLGTIAVDEEHGHVFVSGGGSTTSIVVLDFSGAIVDTITGQEGPAGMVVDESTDTLYVALRNANAISKINTATLDEAGRLPLAPLAQPAQLALAGGRLWFAHSCSGSGGTGSMALDGSDVTSYATGFPHDCPTFATSPTDPDILVSGDIGLSPTTIYVHDVSTTTPTLLTSDFDPGLGTGNLRQLGVTPDGLKVLVASGSPSSVQSLLLSDLTLSTSYPTGRGARGVAVTADGSHVAGAASSVTFDEDLFTFAVGAPTVVRDWDFAGDVVFTSIAFSDDESRLFAVSENDTTGLADFHVLSTPTIPRVQTTLGLGVSRTTVPYNQKVTLTATFGGVPAGRTITFYAQSVFGPRTPIASGTVNSLGRISRVVRVKGKTTFSAEFAGDATYEPARSPNRVVRVRALTKVSFYNFARRAGKYRVYRLGRFPTLTGRVTPNHGGKFLKFVAQYRTPRGWRTFDTGSFPIESNGASYVVLRVRTRGEFRVKATFGGDADHLGSTSAWAYARVS